MLENESNNIFQHVDPLTGLRLSNFLDFLVWEFA